MTALLDEQLPTTEEIRQELARTNSRVRLLRDLLRVAEKRDRDRERIERLFPGQRNQS